MPASLTPSQFQMLRATVAAGRCGRQERSSYGSAWIVRFRTNRGAEVVLTFTERTGDVLLSRNFIRPDTNHEVRNRAGTLILRRYVPTALGRGVVARARKERKQP